MHSTILRRHFGFLLLVLAASTVQGQENLAYTVGTTIENNASQRWAYLLWQGSSAQLLKNGSFAIYAKAGDAASTALYSQTAFSRMETDPAALQALLDRAVNVGEDLALLEENINNLFEGLLSAAYPLTLGEKLSTVILGAQSDADVYEQLLFLGRAHPGVNLCLGLAWCEPLPTGLTTFEVRIWDAASGGDAGVLGRATLDGDNPPTPLPAPGELYQVPNQTGKGHLNVGLRWAAPDDLRRLSLLQYGYNLYRMTKTFAVANGYDVTQPGLTTLMGLLQSNPADVVQVNNAPVMAVKDYYDTGAVDRVDDVSDTTLFTVDDNDRFGDGVPFEACSQYVYFVTARDVLGRDGDVSPGLGVTVCDKVPPYTPKRLRVENDFSYNPDNNPGSSTIPMESQNLKVIWRQNDETDPDAAAVKYYVYRWVKSNDPMTYEADVTYNRIATILHQTGEEENSYVDNGPGSPAMPGDANKTFWYTVRAVDDKDCDGCAANVSGNSAPAFGVLRDRVGPDGPDGDISIRCASLAASFRDVTEVALQEWGIEVPQEAIIPDLAAQVVVEDNCPESELTITQQPPPGTPVQSGKHTITVTVTDAAGNQTTCVRTFTGKADHYLDHYRLTGKRTVGSDVAWVEFYIGDPNGGGSFLGRVNYGPGEAEAYLDYVVDPTVIESENFTVYCRYGSSTGAVSNFATYENNSEPADGFGRLICFEASLSLAYESIEGGCDTHVSQDPGSNLTNPVRGIINLQPTTREWKLYRRIGDGEHTLIAKGLDDYLVSPVVSWEDDAMPSNAARVCYFAQLFDEHGNASPMVRLGCVNIEGSAEMPVPTVTAMEAGGDETDPTLTIKWFAAPDGVDRFHVWIASDPDGLADPISAVLSDNMAPVPNIMTVNTGGDSYDADFRVFYTPRLNSPNFSNAPMFNVTIPVDAGKTYTVMVRAADENNRLSDLSNAEQFKWLPYGNVPAVPFPQVPWPARPLPDVSDSGFVDKPLARQLVLDNGFRGVGIRIGHVNITGRHCLGGTESSPFFTPGNPIDHLYTSDNLPHKSILPFVIYRYQVPNGNFPQVSGEVVQVSPLIEQIAWRSGLSPQFGIYGAIIEDPFIAVVPVSEDFVSLLCTGEVPDLRNNYNYSDCHTEDMVITQQPEPGTVVGYGTHVITITARDKFGNTSTIQTTYTLDPPPVSGPLPYEIHALDTQPVLMGARYRYLLARFKENGEIDQVIPVDEIDVRSSL